MALTIPKNRDHPSVNGFDLALHRQLRPGTLRLCDSTCSAVVVPLSAVSFLFFSYYPGYCCSSSFCTSALSFLFFFSFLLPRLPRKLSHAPDLGLESRGAVGRFV